MSDFASLLGDLKEKAARVASATTTEKDISLGQKRKLPENTRGKRPRKCAVPKDVGNLSVNVSFMCIGAQKAGTTWLHEMFQKCPELVLPDQKEVHFWDWHRRKGLGWYSRQFPQSETSKGTTLLFGEVTPCYMTLPERDIEEIRALFPSVRIVFLARDLVERAWSALLMELRNAARGMEPGQFAMSSDVDARQMIKMEEESNPDFQSDGYFMDRLQHSTHAQRNDYASGLRQWLRFFPKQQLLILNFEDIGKDPRVFLIRSLEHLGARNVQSFVESLDEDELREKVNAATGITSKKPIRLSLRKQMEKHLRKNVQEMNALLDELGYTWRLNDYT